MGENGVVAAMRNMVVMFYIIAPALMLKLSSHFGGEAGAGLVDIMGQGGKAADATAKDSAGLVKTAVTLGLR